MNLFEDFAQQSFRISALVRSERSESGLASPRMGPLLRITRRASLPAEINRILLALTRREPRIDLGGAVLNVPPSVTVSTEVFAVWNFRPSLLLTVTLKGFEVQAEVGSLELQETEGRPAILVRTDSSFKPNVLFVFDDSETPDPKPDETPQANWAALVQRSMMKANVPANHFETVRKSMKTVHAAGLVEPALKAVGGSRPGTVRETCKREAAAIYDAAKKSGAIGTGLIFWLTVGKWILMVLEWALYLSKQETANADG